jgi:hypothetical protein
VRLVRAFFVPLALIRTGAELIGEQDFSSTFLPVGQPEMDALIAVHNRMLTRLREERLRVQEQDALLARLLEASPAGVLTLDFDGRVLLANPASLALLGEDPRGPHRSPTSRRSAVRSMRSPTTTRRWCRSAAAGGSRSPAGRSSIAASPGASSSSRSSPRSSAPRSAPPTAS